MNGTRDTSADRAPMKLTAKGRRPPLRGSRPNRGLRAGQGGGGSPFIHSYVGICAVVRLNVAVSWDHNGRTRGVLQNGNRVLQRVREQLSSNVFGVMRNTRKKSEKKMIGRLLLGSAAIAFSAAAAHADGGYAPALYGSCCATSWTGFYVGGNIGAAWADLHTRDRDEVPGTFKNTPTDFFGGGQIGFNLQRSNFVIGTEVDLGGMALRGTAIQPLTAGLIQSKLDGGFYGDVTGRLGYAWGPTLLYAKGGYAFTDASLTVADVGEFIRKDSNFTGWTVGGGVEYKLNPSWGVKAEYLHFDFGRDRIVAPTDFDRYDNKLAVDTVKIGLNFYFGGGDRYVPLK
jgi:outer membrane immunogenic protein